MQTTQEHKAAKHANEIKHLSESELVDVLQLAMETDARDHALLVTIYRHALRAEEGASIRMGDINWESRELTVARLKGGLKTTQLIPSHRGHPCLDAFKALRRYKKVRKTDGSDFLFLSQKGGKLDHNSINRIFKGYAEKASEAR